MKKKKTIMEPKRLLLTLYRDNHITFTVRGSDKPLGKITLNRRRPLGYVDLVFEFVPSIVIERDAPNRNSNQGTKHPCDPNWNK
ncbi:hypothetical protein ES703_99591 [subsurface metagenome]